MPVLSFRIGGTKIFLVNTTATRWCKAAYFR